MSIVLDNNTKVKFPRTVSRSRLKTKFIPGKMYYLSSAVLSASSMKGLFRSEGHDCGEKNHMLRTTEQETGTSESTVAGEGWSRLLAKVSNIPLIG